MEAKDRENKKITSGSDEWAAILWHSYLTGDITQLNTMTKTVRRLFRHIPSTTRCKICNAPFQGVGSIALGVFGFSPGRSSFNPTLCGRCEKIVKHYQVGAEVTLTLLFADVRNSTQLAEEIGASAFHHLINRFYTTSTEILIHSNSLIDKLIGDEVIGLYLPGIAGPDHARIAIDAAQSLLKATGHADLEGAWVKVGVGVHTGTAYVGAVGSSQSVSDITVLGDAANTAARLASQAGPGEILVSEETCHAAQLSLDHCEPRLLQLKGRSQPVRVRAMICSQQPVLDG